MYPANAVITSSGTGAEVSAKSILPIDDQISILAALEKGAQLPSMIPVQFFVVIHGTVYTPMRQVDNDHVKTTSLNRLFVLRKTRP